MGIRYDNPYAKSFRDLIVYRKAMYLARDLYQLTLSFPKDEKYGLSDQMRRSSRSVGAQIAEAWGKRRFEKSFIAKLVDADGEQMETQHWILVATSCGYISKDVERGFRKQCEDLGKMLSSVIAASAKFCQPQPVRLAEEPSEYLVDAYDEGRTEEIPEEIDQDDDSSDINWLFEPNDEDSQDAVDAPLITDY